MELRWMILRIALPFPLSGGILGVTSLMLHQRLPSPYQGWALVTSSAGVSLGLLALVGLAFARAPQWRRATLGAAAFGALFLTAAVILATDPFCWRGSEAPDGTCGWE